MDTYTVENTNGNVNSNTNENVNVNTNENVNFISTSDPMYRVKMLAYVMDKLNILAQYPVYVDNAIAQVGALAINDSLNGGTGDAARASAIGNSVAAREETNRALIEFLKQIYNDVKPISALSTGTANKNSAMMPIYQSLASLIDRIDPDNDTASDLFESARGMLREIG